MNGSVAALKNEFAGLRTGRASAALLDPVTVEAYGTSMPINQVGTVSAPEPRLLTVQVWDKCMVKAVDKAIRDAGLGLNPQMDGQLLRIPIPELNEERRKELAKLAHKYAEQARIAVRNVRRDGMETLKRLEKDHKIGQDEHHKLGEELQKLTDAHIRDIDQALHPKNRKSCRSDAAGFRAKRRQAPSPRRESLPRHVAIIMDGNGRWARRRHLPRAAGHVAGVSAVRAIVRAAIDIGLPNLTLYAFSSENWKRPPTEVTHLMGLFRAYFREDVDELVERNVRMRIIGNRSRARKGHPGDDRRRRERRTVANTGLNLTFAFDYGAQEEIAAAAREMARAAARGELDPDAITPAMFAARLLTRGLPDPDLLIRTSGEHRLSNFLLWQSAYSEFVFVDTLWPDFTRAHFFEVLEHFAQRERRFGAVTPEAVA